MAYYQRLNTYHVTISENIFLIKYKVLVYDFSQLLSISNDKPQVHYLEINKLQALVKWLLSRLSEVNVNDLTIDIVIKNVS